MNINRRDALLAGISSLASRHLDATSARLLRDTETGQAAGGRRRLHPIPGTKVKVFDPKDGFGAIRNIRTFTDPTIFKRDGRWWMVAGGFDLPKRTILLFSASLPAGADLRANGWQITTSPEDATAALELVPPASAASWDGAGGMHCPSYVRGWDPKANGGAGAWRERIYYAGSATSFTGPYSIGYLESNGSAWSRQGDYPVFTATETWEIPTVAEPYVTYSDGKWRMWYVAGPDKARQFLQGYAESEDGRTNWTKKLYLPGDQDVFDNNVIAVNGRFECVFARYPLLSRKLAPRDGLWWQMATHPYSDASRWSEPIQLLSPADGGASWHAGGVWKPAFRYSQTDPTRAFVFFDACYPATGAFPTFTLGCIECQLIH